MLEALWSSIAVALAFAGMACLALAMEVHWSQVMHQPACEARGVRRVLRLSGAVVLVLSLWACLMADRPSMAVLVWVLLLAAAGLVVALLLAD